MPRIIDFLGYCPIEPGEALGARLRRAREARGLSLGRLAALVRVDESTVARWERGSRLVPAHFAIVVEAILGKVPFEAAGARPRDRRLTTHDPRAIRRLRAAGLSLREIGQRLRVSASTVRSRLQGESESE